MGKSRRRAELAERVALLESDVEMGMILLVARLREDERAREGGSLWLTLLGAAWVLSAVWYMGRYY